MPYPILRIMAGAFSGAAGLILISAGAFAAPIDMALVAVGVGILGPLVGFFTGEANGRRSSPP